jgi:hypothetical protein
MFVPYRKHIWASAACYRDSFTFVYVDDVRNLQETHIWASTVCYRDSFTFTNFCYTFHCEVSAQRDVV